MKNAIYLLPSSKKIVLESTENAIFINFNKWEIKTLSNLYTFSNKKGWKPKLTKLHPTNFKNINVYINFWNLTIEIIIILFVTS